MTPSARLQAAIILLDEIIAAARDSGASADVIAQRFFKARRYAGSGDRRAIRELAYRAIRAFGAVPKSARSAFVAIADVEPELAAQFDGSPYGPAKITEAEPRAVAMALPQWVEPHFAMLVDDHEKAALLQRAPLDVRVPQNCPAEQLAAEFPDAEALALPNAFRLAAGSAVEQSALYHNGQVEVQDLGSQAICHAAAVHRPMRVLDLCAGAGGKTLALAALSDPAARLVAADTDRGRLQKIAPRAVRAGIANIETRLLNPGKEAEPLADLVGSCDLVLVDAPCSGSGTWRRNPELRWRLTPDSLARTAALQARLLALAAGYVAPGGRLVYAVCSLFDREGAEQIDAFLVKNSGWQRVGVALPLGRTYRQDMLLTPYHDGTDGFFFSILEKS